MPEITSQNKRDMFIEYEAVILKANTVTFNTNIVVFYTSPTFVCNC